VAAWPGGRMGGQTRRANVKRPPNPESLVAAEPGRTELLELHVRAPFLGGAQPGWADVAVREFVARRPCTLGAGPQPHRGNGAARMPRRQGTRGGGGWARRSSDQTVAANGDSPTAAGCDARSPETGPISRRRRVAVVRCSALPIATGPVPCRGGRGSAG
jgi:hypothetical protein